MRTIASVMSKLFSRSAVVPDEHEMAVQRVQDWINEKPRRQHEETRQMMVARGYATTDFAPLDCVEQLRKLSVKTLTMIEKHERPTDFNPKSLEIGEARLRSGLHVSKLTTLHWRAIPFHMADAALAKLHSNHDFPDDLTAMGDDEVVGIAAACDLIINLELEKRGCPRVLSSIVMSRPDRLKDVVSYVRQRSTPETIGNLNLESIEEFLNTPAQPLREGTL